MFTGERRRMAAWFAAFACYAGVVALTSGGSDAVWGRWAVGAYALTAIWLWCSRRTAGPLLVSLGFALVAPMVWLAVRAPATADVSVVARSAVLLVHHGSPYLPASQLVTWQAYNPYLPAMAIFGLPHAAGLPGVLGDPRIWMTLTSAALLVAAFCIAAPRGVRGRTGWRMTAVRKTAFLAASPVLALPLAVGITDPPVLALLCFALACASRLPAERPLAGSQLEARLPRALLGRSLLSWPVLAGLAVGAACAMKATAWPALPVIAAMFWTRDGARTAVRFAATSAATAAALVVATAPALVLKPSAFFQNTVEYPLGLTRQLTPATSPLPGHLLASTGPAGHTIAVGLLALAGLAFAASLVLRPPADVRAVTWRVALGLAALFTLAPATRFGYFAYPAGLIGWLALASPPQASRVLRLGRTLRLGRILESARIWGRVRVPAPALFAEAPPVEALSAEPVPTVEPAPDLPREPVRV
jgi:hypothetical protein